jgi:tRNA A-37 threonylcarbamoyl transferase component Bud32
MQQYVCGLNVVCAPDVLFYCKKTHTMVMPRVGEMSVADMYGDAATDLPDTVFASVVETVQQLVTCGIEYPDLTGYNFVEDMSFPGKVWIIDFEHASFNDSIMDPAVIAVARGERTWNERFA